eukprot:scaffold84043_cov16-Prasinocladus_malaysianus.AAC.3
MLDESTQANDVCRRKPTTKIAMSPGGESITRYHCFPVQVYDDYAATYMSLYSLAPLGIACGVIDRCAYLYAVRRIRFDAQQKPTWFRY